MVYQDSNLDVNDDEKDNGLRIILTCIVIFIDGANNQAVNFQDVLLSLYFKNQ